MEAVIMTGGKGTRLAPYTKVLPKGLLPIGEKPILEIIVRQLSHYGFQSITMACGYLAPLIQTYFGGGKKWGVSIRYQVEGEPLGTVGPLHEMSHLQEPFLVLNCDVLTTLDFRQMWDFHCAGKSILTIASQKKNVLFDLGVLEVESDCVTHFLEKPTRSARVSMGIYMMSPEVIQYIPANQYFDIPDLIRCILAEGKGVRHFANDAFWIDIGRPTEYLQASEDFLALKNQILPDELVKDEPCP